MKFFKNKLAVLATVIISLNIGCALACTGIGLHYKNQYFVGKNHDWINKEAAIVVRPRGTENQDPTYMREDKLLDWAAKYGSITVNLVEQNKIRPGAMVGMNEKGLSVLTLWHDEAKYPTVPTKPIVSTLLFANYLLDNAANVSDAIKLIQKVDMEPSMLPHDDAVKIGTRFGIDPNAIKDINIHFFVEDKKGHAAVIEYVNGKLVLSTGKTLPLFVIANDSYSDSIQNIKQFKEFGGSKYLSNEFDSLFRFTRAAYSLKALPLIESKQQAISQAFNVLAHAQNSSPYTQWAAVFDLSDRTMYLRSIDNQQIRVIRLNKFNLAKGQPLKVLSMNDEELSGYVEDEFKNLEGNNDGIKE